MQEQLNQDEIGKLRAALDVLRAVKTRIANEASTLAGYQAIDCCERGIDAIIDLLDA